ncbi:CHAP domain-containing protein [Vescimonas sp.]|uniref:CHAP domain-containing protein n=1 Tax=Vescimonas sp. TaxID=2892404 RepID=UPI00307D87FF
MADLKTRRTVKGTVKTIDRAAVAAERLKSATVRTKDAAERNAAPAETSSQEYGAQKLERTAQGTVSELGFQFRKRGRRGFSDARRNADKAKTQMQKCRDVLRENKPKKAVQAPHTPRPAKTVQASARPVQRTGRIVVKPPSVGTEAAQAAKAAAKTAPKAAQTVKAAARAAAQTVQSAAKTAVSAAKAAIAGTKAVIAAITAGGWAAVAIILVLCVVGLIASSCFGIFFSGEDSGTGQTMRQAVKEINADYQSQIDAARADSTYDELEMSGSRAVWPEVLAVYAVKTTTDPDDPQEVATVDDSKKAILKDIFWQMNDLSSHTESKAEDVITETDDGHGNIVETVTTVTRTYLYITVSHKTAEEMAEQFNFTADQRQQLSELLAEENRKLWSSVLYGIYSGDDAIVTVALSQVGNIGGEPYWSWYGFGSRVEWCACFVSWCANECGYIDTGVCPKFAGCGNGVQWFQERGQWLYGSTEPAPGMVIFFDWDNKGGSGPQDGEADHVGIVQKVGDGIIYTVEGNSGNLCRVNRYPVGHYEILGYGVLCP